MADSTDTPNGDNSPQRTSAALKLPKVTFAKVREIVVGSEQMNGPATPAVIADQINRTAKGQGWSDRWSTVRFLGFIAKTENGKYDVTDLGRRFLGEDEEDSTRAAQEAIMRTGFGPLIKRFNTGAPNLKAMANVLVSDYGVPQAAASKAADLLVEMATECKLIVDGRVKPADIERAEEAAGDQAAAAPDPSAAPKLSPKPATPNPAAPKPAPAAAGAKPTDSTPAPPAHAAPVSPPAGSTPAPASNGGGAIPVPFGLGPTVILNVDATKLSATEIMEIVRELRKDAASS
jgi:hypothetical protein